MGLLGGRRSGKTKKDADKVSKEGSDTGSKKKSKVKPRKNVQEGPEHTKKETFETGAKTGQSVHSADTAKTRESLRKDNFRATKTYEKRLRDEKADEELKALTSASTAETISANIQRARSMSQSSHASNASMLSYPDTEPEVMMAPPPPRKRGPAPLQEAKDEVKRKLNLKRLTNKEGRQDVYHSIVKCMNEIETLAKESLDVLMVNKDDEDHLPIIKGFAEAKGLYSRRKQKCVEMLGEDKTYLDHVRLHRQCLVDGVLFDSKRIYNEQSFTADMNTIKVMKRGIMKLVGKNPDEWEYDPEEFEELRRVRGQLQKVWGGHLLKKQKQLDKLRGNAPVDVDKMAGQEQMTQLLKKGMAPSAFTARGAPQQAADFYEKGRKRSVAPDAPKPGDAGPNQRRRKSEQIESGEQWAKSVAADAKPPESPTAGAAQETDMAAYSVDEDEGEVDIPQEISDAMDSFVGDKFYKCDVNEVPDGKGKKFAGNCEGGKPEGRGVLILGDRSQHIGNFRKGKAAGLGVLLNRSNDTIYVGSWVENRKIGRFFTLEKTSGQTYLERYEPADTLAERQAGPVIPTEVIKEKFLKKLARLKAKEEKAKEGEGEQQIENRRASAGELAETRSRTSQKSKQSSRRKSANDADGGAEPPRRGSQDRRGSLPKIWGTPCIFHRIMKRESAIGRVHIGCLPADVIINQLLDIFRINYSLVVNIFRINYRFINYSLVVNIYKFRKILLV